MPTCPILIIDDEESIRTASRFALEDGGYTVAEASDGQAGLDFLRGATQPLVVLLDLMMPTMSGIALLQVLRQEPALAERHVFVLFTAATTFTADTLCVYLPSHPLLALPKPFALDDLLATVAEAAAQLATRQPGDDHT